MKKKLVITIPPGSFMVSLAVGIVYNWQLGVAAFALFVVVGTTIVFINK